MPRARTDSGGRVATFVICLAFMGALILQWRTIAHLRSANEELLDSAAQLQRIHREQRVRARRELGTSESAALRAEREENTRLRVEMARLREQATAAAAGKPVAPASPSTAPRFPQETPVPEEASGQVQEAQWALAKDRWSNAGFGTPSATVQTVLWAGRELEWETYLEAMAPEMRERVESESRGRRQLADLREPIAEARGLRILREEAVAADEVEVTYVVEGWNEDRPLTQPLRRVGESWKLSGPPRGIE